MSSAMPFRLAALGALLAWPASVQADDLLPPQIVHEPCDQYAKGQAFDLWARFYDDSPLFDPKVIYKSGRDANWRNAPFAKQPGTDDFKAVIPARNLDGPLYYFIEVFDENGNGPARYGTPDAPIKVTAAVNPPKCRQIDTADVPVTTDASPPEGVTDPSTVQAAAAAAASGGDGPALRDSAAPPSSCDAASRPLYCEPWLWGGLGAVALAGAGLAVYFLYFTEDDPALPPPSSVRLRVGAPDPTAASLRWGP